jgi:16S rRNA (cytidine1402-2'-O)-methyltransferase
VAARDDSPVARRFIVDQITVVSGTLYVIASPLGNLADLSERAVQILRQVELIAAEDTRRARILLSHIGARPKVYSYHAHSPAGRLDLLERFLVGGADVALLTDAGTPTVSDPGSELVLRARAAGANVVPIPGPSAVATALSVSGMPADQYTFLGFLPRKGPERRRQLEAVAASPRTVVVFEAANRLLRLLLDLSESCGPDRPGMVARELTKVHEELKCGNLADLAVYYEEHTPRGEVTVLIAGTEPVEPAVDAETVRSRAQALLADGLSRKDAANRIAAEFSLPRREVYRMVTEL